MCRIVLLILLVVALPVTANADPKIWLVNRSKLLSTDQVMYALGIFRGSCRPLGDENIWTTDVTLLEVDVLREWSSFYKKKGWDITLTVKVQLADKLTNFPEYTKETGVNSGQALWYKIGLSGEAGYFASKRVSQFACSMGLSSDEDVFRYFPDFSRVLQ